MTTLLSDTTPKARKSYTCDSCGRAILAGTVYRRSFQVDGGEAWTWRSHPECTRAGNILWDHGIRGDEWDHLINVSDMEHDDRVLIYRADPDLYSAIWPDAPIPGEPQAVK